MSGPYRTPADATTYEETPESILTDTLQRLNNIDEDDAKRVVRGLAAFIGFNVGARHVDVDIIEPDEDSE